jgi:hypothetical protein
MNNLKLYLVTIIILLGAIVFLLFNHFSYNSFTECQVKELQKLSFQPSQADKQSIELYCELTIPYEKEIYGPTIELNGNILKVINNEQIYKVTKVEVFVAKGECGSQHKEIESLTYYVSNGVDGATFENFDYKCHFPDKTKYFGKINKARFGVK